MKNFSLILIALFCLTSAEAQITVSNATFPTIGDTLKMAIDLNPVGISLTGAGGPFEWDLSTLQADQVQVEIYRPASEGSVQVPGASMFVEGGQNIENYFTSTASAFQLIAVKGPVSQVFGLETVFFWTPPRVLRHAPLTFPSTFSSQSNLLIPFSTDAIPQAILDSLGLPVVPDSIRVRIQTESNDFVDAFGTVTLPQGSFPALRVKRTEYVETRVDVLLPFFGWQDVTDILIAGGNIPGLGKDTINSMHFFGEESKEVLTELTLDASAQNVIQARFKYDPVSAAVDDLRSGGQVWSVFPNPFSSRLFIELHAAPAQSYRVRLFDAQGREAFATLTRTDAEGRLNIDLGHLPSGTYTMTLYDLHDRMVTSTLVIKL